MSLQWTGIHICILFGLLAGWADGKAESAVRIEWAVPQILQAATEKLHPKQLPVEIHLPGGSTKHIIQLNRVDHLISPNLKTFVAGNGATELWRNNDGTSHSTGETVSAYREDGEVSVFTVRGHGKSFRMEGVFVQDGVTYEVKSSVSTHTEGHDMGKRSLHPVGHVVDKSEIAYTEVDDIYTPTPDGNPVAYRHYSEVIERRGKKHPLVGDMLTKRTKRGATDYEVEVMILVDYQLYTKFYAKAADGPSKHNDTISELQYYFVHYANIVDSMYQTITAKPWTIRVKLVALHIASANTEGVKFHLRETTFEDIPAIEAYDSYGDVQDFVDTAASLATFDHLMSVTGYELIKITAGVKSGSIAGLATVSGVCTESRTSINEYGGGLSGAVIAAHELGHNLGASHDSSGDGCPANEQFIMSSVSSPSSEDTHANYFRFSSCSQTYFSDLFDTLNNDNENCLKNTATYISEWNGHIDQLPGQRYTPDELCEQMYGAGWKFAAGAESANICHRIHCYAADLRTNTYSAARGPHGTTCGDRKWCQLGECTENAAAPSVPDSCPHGDSISKIYSNSDDTCTTMNKGLCYTEGIRLDCCTRCPAEFGKEGCEYGDASNCALIKTPSSCYQANILEACCETCEGHANYSLPESCRYGDKFTNCNEFDRSAICSGSNRDACCGYCATELLTTTTTLTTTPQTTTTVAATTTTPTATTTTTTTTATTVTPPTTGATATTTGATATTTGETATTFTPLTTPTPTTTVTETAATTFSTTTTIAPMTTETKTTTFFTTTTTTSTTTASLTTAAPTKVSYRVTIRFSQGTFPACNSLGLRNRNSDIYKLLEFLICEIFKAMLSASERYKHINIAACRISSFGCGSITAATALDFDLPQGATTTSMYNASDVPTVGSLQQLVTDDFQNHTTELEFLGSTVAAIELVNECASSGNNSCPLGATCNDLSDLYTCTCPKNWRDDAEPGEIAGTVCTETCSGQCLNGGNCTERTGTDILCDCPPGFPNPYCAGISVFVSTWLLIGLAFSQFL